MPARWVPVAEGSLGTRTRRAIRELAAMLGDPAAATSPSLALGDAGTAVFFAYLSRSRFPIRHAKERARLHAERATGAIGKAPLPLGLFGGLAGIAWMLQHLRGVELPRRDVCGPLDAALRMALAQGPIDEPDLVSGLCGVGIYALARRDRALATAAVAQLRRSCVAHGDGALWRTRGSDLIDLGTAHGLAGAVAMLGQASAARIPGATRLWQRATRSLLHHARWDQPSVFPDKVGADIASRDCRLAWCYGDLGVACALQTVGETTGQAGLRTTALRLARHAAARTPATSGVVDCGVCHGAAGVALGFQRMYSTGGDVALRDAARSWLSRALEYGIPQDIRDGAHSRGLLGGAGLGLVYLAATTPGWPRWCSALAMVPAASVRRQTVQR